MVATAPGKSADPLVDRSNFTAEQIAQAVCLITYLRSAQQPTVAAPPQSAAHLSTVMLENYAANGFPLEVGLEWSLATTRHAIEKRPHSSTLSLESTTFYRGIILEQTQKGLSIDRVHDSLWNKSYV